MYKYREVSIFEAPLDRWYAKARHQNKAFSHIERDPAQWVGLFEEERLLSAYGFTQFNDGTICLDAALCEPSKVGLAALAAFGIILKKAAEGKRVVFFVESTNRRMKFIADKLLGARVIAEMREI